MKKIPVVLLLLALAPVIAFSQKEFKPLLQKTKQTVMDFRANSNVAPPKISVAAQRAVLSKVFGKYLLDPDKCNPQFDSSGSEDRLKAARDAGQIAPAINDMVNGSFTAAGQTQVAYVIAVGECNASHADNYGTKRLVIFSGQQLVANVDADFQSSILLKMDLNSDGIDELLMTSGDMNQGTLVEMASLVDFQKGRRHLIQDFGTVTEDSCASEATGSSAKASVLSLSDLEPGTMPRLKVDNYVASCRTPKRWRFLSSGKMPE